MFLKRSTYTIFLSSSSLYIILLMVSLRWSISILMTGKYSSKLPDVERSPAIPSPCNCFDVTLKGVRIFSIIVTTY